MATLSAQAGTTNAAVKPKGDGGRGLRIGLVVALIGVLLGYGYRYGVRDHVLARNFGVVEDGKFYRSGRLTPATMERVVRENKIKTVIDLGAYGERTAREVLEQKTIEALGVTRYRFGLQGDGTGEPEEYVQALKLMADPANHPVLIHCAAGAQRTSAAIMLYRKAFEGVPFDVSLEEAKRYKHDPKDNPFLMEYLQKNGDAIIAKVIGTAGSGAATGQP